MSKHYILRTCNPDLTSHGGFVWPESGHVVAPDWDPRPVCGHGLHGLLNGQGDGSLLNWAPNAKWIVCEIEEYIDLKGKVKFAEAEVVFCGDRDAAIKYLSPMVAEPNMLVGSTLSGADNCTLTGEDNCTLTGGRGSTLCWKIWDENYYRLHVFYVGENDVKANTPYQFSDGKIVEVQP